MVSDLFTERSQFEMMYLADGVAEGTPPEKDEILLQYLVPATCKAAAVLRDGEPGPCGPWPREGVPHFAVERGVPAGPLVGLPWPWVLRRHGAFSEAGCAPGA